MGLLDKAEDLAEDAADTAEDAAESAKDAAEDAADAAEDAAEAAAEAAEDAAEDAANAAEDAANAAEDAAEDAADAAEEAADTAADAAEAVADAAEEAVEDAEDAVEEAAEDIGEAIEDLAEAVDDVIDAVAGVVAAIFRIPGLGRLLAQLWNGVLHYVWFGIGYLVDSVVGVFGQPTKNLRICVVVLRDDDAPVAPTDAVQPAVERAREIFRDEASVDLELLTTTVPARPAPEAALSVGCDFRGWVDDLGVAGTYFATASNNHCGESAFPRLVGLGSPVVAFVVREVEGAEGCSFGHFTDYVTIEANRSDEEVVSVDGRTMAHELAHSCGLFHVDDPQNLLNPGGNGTELTDGQVRQFRASPHVTYW